MSRTYRRRRQRHEHCWVLREWQSSGEVLAPQQIDLLSKEGRRAIALSFRYRTHDEQRSSARVPRVVGPEPSQIAQIQPGE
jgi:hypothetical protein